MGAIVPFQETITTLRCVGTHLVFMNEAGDIVDIDLAEKLPPGVQTLTELDFDPLTKSLLYKDENDVVRTVDISSICSEFAYNPGNHTVTHNGIPYQLNCGRLNFNPSTCVLSYIDEKGVTTAFTLPQDQVIYNPEGCLVTILPAKGGSPIQFPAGVPAGEVGLVLNGKNLEFTYKDKKCVVPLPNSVIGCQYDRGTNTLRMLFCDGTFDEKQLAKASLTCNNLEDGTQVLNFQDGCGGGKMFNIPAINIPVDTDQPPTVVGSVLTFVYGGDGNDAVVAIDICDIIANNCNATITNIDPVTGAFSFIDNAGETFTVPGHVPPTVVGSGDITVTPSVGPNGETVYTVDYTHVPSDPAPVVMGADDAVVTSSVGSNGEIIYTVSCLKPVVVGAGDINVTPSTGPNGETVYTVEFTDMDAEGAIPPVVVGSEFIDVTPSTGPNGETIYTITGPAPCCHYNVNSTVELDPASPAIMASNPPKSIGNTATQKHPNGFSTFTCTAQGWVNNWQCIFAEEADPTTVSLLNVSGDAANEQDPAAILRQLVCIDNTDPANPVLKLKKQCADDPVLRNEEGEIIGPDCDYDTDDLVSGKQIDAWLDTNMEFSNGPITAYTSTCCQHARSSINVDATGVCAGVDNSQDSTAAGNYAQIQSSQRSEANGNRSTVQSSRDSTANGTASVVLASRDSFANATESVNIATDRSETLGPWAGNYSSRVTVASGNNSVNIASATSNATNSGSGNYSSNLGQVDVLGSANLATGTAQILSGTNNQANIASSNVTIDASATAPGGADNVNLSSNTSQILGGREGLNAATENTVITGPGQHRANLATGGSENSAAQNAAIVGDSGSCIGPNAFQAGIVGSRECEIGMVNPASNAFIGSSNGSSVDLTNGASYAAILSSTGTVNPTGGTVVGGWGGGLVAKGAGTTANRNWELNSITGDINASGAISGGFAFPGFGEYAVANKEIAEGLFVVFDGVDGVRTAKEGEDFDGISRKQLAASAGGGQSVDNLEYLHDDFGNRLMEEVAIKNEVQIVDEEASDKATKEAITKAQAKAKQNTPEGEEVMPVIVDPVVVLKTVVTEETVTQPVRNPNYDPSKTSQKIGVEMLGRTWINTIGEANVGDYLAAGRGGQGKVSKERTRCRVLAVKGRLAYVVIK